MTHVYADNYTDWLYDITEKWISKCSRNTYHHAIVRLEHAEFNPHVSRDLNRVRDAIALWKNTTGIMEDTPLSASILEVMVSLAMRCEKEIMHEPRLGDRTHLWFWMMFQSLGFDQMYDENYNAAYVTDVITKLNSRKYKKNGEGGLFTVHTHPEVDMRKIELWYQMQLALREYLGI